MAIVASGQISLIDLNDSKQLQLFIGCNQPKTQIFNPNDNSYTPSWTSSKPVLTPQLFVAGTSTDIISQAKSINWYEGNGTTPLTSNTNYTIASTGVKTLTINTNILSSKNSQLFVCEVVYTDPSTGFDITTKADFEFVKVTNGQKGDKGDAGANAVTAVLSNDSQTVPTDKDGNNGVYGSAVTTISVYVGATDDTSNWSATASPSTGVTGSLSGKTYSVTGMTVDTGYVDITVSRSGYASVTKRFTVTKSKQGATGNTGSAGQNATAYWLVSSVPAIGKNIAGIYNPTTITVSAKSQTGTGTPANYSGRFIISESTDGSTFTTKYTSSANEASKTHTPSAGIKSVKVQLCLAGGTSNVLDEQIIPVVSDGATGASGQDAVVSVVWTPDGNTVRNSSGTLTAEVNVYKGSSPVVPSAFKWYIQDPTATATSGGDADGGAGWRLLNSTYNAGVTGYTTSKITIPASAIASVETFMSIVTYSNVKYRDVCTVVDVSDPITVAVIGANTFKNGEGSTSLTAKLYRNGEEIDSGGTGYTYTWALYNADNSINSSFGTKTGKTITVSASSVNGRANLVCEVSPK
ncbi:MAG: hypothetical protein ABS939_03560 [Psychrobacillus sp.]